MLDLLPFALFFDDGAQIVWLGFTLACGVVALVVPRDWMAWVLPSVPSAVLILAVVAEPIVEGGLAGFTAGVLLMSFFLTWMPWIAAMVGRGVRWTGDAYLRSR